MSEYEDSMREYLRLKKEIEIIEERAKLAAGERRKKMAELEATITKRAEADGLNTVPTSLGTAYWSNRVSAKISSPADFDEYVKKNDAWELVDMRARRKTVDEYVQRNGTPPPGVSYTRYRVFAIREERND